MTYLPPKAWTPDEDPDFVPIDNLSEHVLDEFKEPEADFKLGPPSEQDNDEDSFDWSEYDSEDFDDDSCDDFDSDDWSDDFDSDDWSDDFDDFDDFDDGFDDEDDGFIDHKWREV